MSESELHLENIERSLNWIQTQLDTLSKKTSITDKVSQGSLNYIENKLAWEKAQLDQICT